MSAPTNVVRLKPPGKALAPLFGTTAEGKAAPYRDRAVFADAIMTDASLNAAELRVALLLAKLFDYAKGYAWPSIDTIAATLKVSRSTVERAVRGLAAKGWLLVETPRGQGVSNRYVPNLERFKPVNSDGLNEPLTRQSATVKPVKSRSLNPSTLTPDSGLPDTGLDSERARAREPTSRACAQTQKPTSVWDTVSNAGQPGYDEHGRPVSDP